MRNHSITVALISTTSKMHERIIEQTENEQRGIADKEYENVFFLQKMPHFKQN